MFFLPLGPLFFIIYVNELNPVTVRGNIIMFADDTVLFSHLDPKNPKLTANQQDLDSLHTWCKNHNLSINLNKTSYVIFGQKRFINKVAKKQIQVKVNAQLALCLAVPDPERSGPVTGGRPARTAQVTRIDWWRVTTVSEAGGSRRKCPRCAECVTSLS